MIVLYSLTVMASSVPSFRALTSLLLVPYYIFVPGYAVTSALAGEKRLIAQVFNSVVWSLALVVTVYSLQSIAPSSQALPLSITVPVLTLLFFAYGYFHGR